MKNRLFSILTAAALLLSFCVPVSATELQSSAADAAAEQTTIAADEENASASDAQITAVSDETADAAAGEQADAVYDEQDAAEADGQEADAADGAAAETTEAAADPFSITTGSGTDGTRIAVQQSGEQWLLMLPASADPAAVPLYFDGGTLTVSGDQSSVVISGGDTIDLTALCSGTDDSGCYALTVTGGTSTMELSVHVSASVAALYLTSADPVNQGREWVEASADKTNVATGSMVLQNPDGSVVYNGALTQLKGRGNSTWRGEKKPYQIKLDKKTDLLETGNSDNKNKTWVLLANYYDATLLRNSITFDLAAGLEMYYAVEHRFVDLYYDGEYRGSYLLCEKVAVDSGRLDITDLEEENEDANPEIDDFPVLTRGTGTTENGCEYHY